MKEQPHFVYVVRPTRLEMLTEGPSPEEEAIISRHFEYLTGLAEKGVVLLAGRTQDADESSFGMVILRTGSEGEAREIMLNDPAVRGKVMSARLHPYRIAIAASRLSH